jgi:hypothetical protein
VLKARPSFSGLATYFSVPPEIPNPTTTLRTHHAR